MLCEEDTRKCSQMLNINSNSFCVSASSPPAHTEILNPHITSSFAQHTLPFSPTHPLISFHPFPALCFPAARSSLAYSLCWLMSERVSHGSPPCLPRACCAFHERSWRENEGDGFFRVRWGWLILSGVTQWDTSQCSLMCAHNWVRGLQTECYQKHKPAAKVAAVMEPHFFGAWSFSVVAAEVRRLNYHLSIHRAR